MPVIIVSYINKIYFPWMLPVLADVACFVLIRFSDKILELSLGGILKLKLKEMDVTLDILKKITIAYTRNMLGQSVTNNFIGMEKFEKKHKLYLETVDGLGNLNLT